MLHYTRLERLAKNKRFSCLFFVCQLIYQLHVKSYQSRAPNGGSCSTYANIRCYVAVFVLADMAVAVVVGWLG